MIVYGSFRLVFVVLGNVLAPDGLEQSLKDFAELMLRPTAGASIGTHSILAFSGRPDFGFQWFLLRMLNGPLWSIGG